VFFANISYSQQDDRIQQIKNELDTLAKTEKGLKEKVEVNIDANTIGLTGFLVALSKIHNLNINVSNELSDVRMVSNFSGVTVKDLLVYLVSQYDLDIAFTGNILFIKRFSPPVVPYVPDPNVAFNLAENTLTLDLKNDLLTDVFRKITDLSGKNLLYAPEIGQKRLTSYIQQMPFDKALENLARTNGLTISNSREGFFLFDLSAVTVNANPNQEVTRQVASRNFNANYHYEILDTLNFLVKVEFSNVPASNIIYDLIRDFKLDAYFATPPEGIGNVSFNASKIKVDALFKNIFESLSTNNRPSPDSGNNPRSNTPNNSISNSSNYGFKKENGIYFFGYEQNLSVRKIELVTLQHRSIELLGDPTQVQSRQSGRTPFAGVNLIGGAQQNFTNQSSGIGRNDNNFREPFNNNKMEALLSILPKEVTDNLEITVDYELNSFIVSGASMAIERFKAFISKIDKPIPVILIEVMILEVNKSSVVETGITWGIGDKPVKTGGNIFPTTDLTLGAETVNRIIGGFDGFVNIGNVVPEFFATIKAMEANGNIKVRSTPKLSTLNGHRATLSIGETTYFVVTTQNFIGSQIPQVSEIQNFQPLDAELAVSIKPLVSGNGQITLDINVVQSTFTDDRITEEAPPGLSSREFSSIVRVRDQDIVVLGGLEENVKNDTGTGVPLLSRIPVIKWFFSSRRREDSKRKLSILIKPTVIY